MPTDPATVPPLTDADIVRILREVGYVISSGRDADTVKNNPDGAASARAAYALAASRVDTAEVERRAARKALAECAAWLGKGESQPVRFDEDGRFLLAFERVNAFSDRYLAREYPAPAPRECVLSDGSVVTYHPEDRECNWRRDYSRSTTLPPRHVNASQWVDILNVTDTGADFDALKRFAAEVR